MVPATLDGAGCSSLPMFGCDQLDAVSMRFNDRVLKGSRLG
jgi:hypothetical protein